MRVKIFSLWLALLGGLTASAQYRLDIRFTGPDSALIHRQLKYQDVFDTPQQRDEEIQQVMLKLTSMSYLAPALDTLAADSSSLQLRIDPGNSYAWAALQRGNVPEEALSEAGFRLKVMQGSRINPAQVAQMMNKLLQFYENRGFPFAELRLTGLQFAEKGLEASLFLDPGPLVTIDSIELVGEASISQNFLKNYLGIRPGDLYNEQVLKQVDQRLSGLVFAEPVRASVLYFYENKARLVVYLRNKRSDQADGIIGFAPNSENNSSKLLLTGELHLKFNNLFSSGKMFELNWRSFLQRSQELKMRFNWPYLFNTRLGADARFELLKYDTLFLNLNAQLGLQYQLKANNYLQFFVNRQQTNLLTVDTSQIRLSKAFPQQAPVQATLYGLGIHLEQLDYRFNPRSGYIFELNGAAGRKKLMPNSQIQRVVFYDSLRPEGYTLYDSVPTKYTQYNITYKLARFIPLFKRVTILAMVDGAHLVAPRIYYNELFRIGGAKSLRGFDEQSITASQYVMGTLEFRYLFQRNGYFQVFANAAWVSRKVDTQPLFTDYPYGFGAGVSLEAGNAVITLAYALGSQQHNPIEFKTGKVHIGIVNYF